MQHLHQLLYIRMGVVNYSVYRMMKTGACLDSVWNTHRILVFAHIKVIMEVNPRMEVTFTKGKVHVNKFSWLKVNGVNCCSLGKICNFSV